MLRLLLRLYRTDPSFRGFSDFAAFGALALLCMNPPTWSWSLPSLHSSQSAAKGPASAAVKPVPGATGQAGSPRAPGRPQRHPFDDVDAALSDNLLLSRGAPRLELDKAVNAIRAQNLDGAGQILGPLDDNDVNVQFFRALVLARKGDRMGATAAYAAPAAAGHSLAAYLLGEDYRTGQGGVAMDKARAFELWKSACDAGLSKACYALAAVFYAGGEMGWRDDVKAQTIFARLANSNHPGSINWLGVFADHGRGGMSRDYVAANSYFRRAAELGDTIAMRNCYLMLRAGHGVDRNIDEALIWLRRSADLGDIISERLLGQFLANGEEGTTPDPVRGAALLRKAALSNDGLAQQALGELYDQGRGLPHDGVQAYVFYGLANFYGVASARAKMTALQGRLSNDERERAERLLIAALPASPPPRTR
jgi:TPR repeat protein